MRGKTATVRIIVTSDGVYRVQICGKSWDDEADANRIYEQIRHLVREIDRAVKTPQAVSGKEIM